MPPTGDSAEEILGLLAAVRAGDRAAWERLLDRHRPKLRRMVAVRLDRRLQGRIDASDVIQEAFIEADRRLADYLAGPDMPFHLWLRFLVGQRLLILHRQHLGTYMRDAGREQPWPDSTADGLANQFLDRGPSPSEDAARQEALAHLRSALNDMDTTDREVLTLRHFEQLTNVEVAQVLGIEASAASKRYLRALERLQEVLEQRPDLFGPRDGG
jgi:RNA polymerase sigma-70 factor, ECF subfamily